MWLPFLSFLAVCSSYVFLLFFRNSVPYEKKHAAGLVSSMMMGVPAGTSPGLESGSIGVGQKEQFKNPPIRMEKDTKVVFV